MKTLAADYNSSLIVFVYDIPSYMSIVGTGFK